MQEADEKASAPLQVGRKEVNNGSKQRQIWERTRFLRMNSTTNKEQFKMEDS